MSTIYSFPWRSNRHLSNIFRRRKLFMQALIVVDVQNEFSPKGQRPVPNHAQALEHIRFRVEEAREQRRPIGWVIHFNKPHESRAFVPGAWGAEQSPGFGERSGFGPERQ